MTDAATVRMSRSHWLVRLRRHPSALLLLAQLACVPLYALLEHARSARTLLGVFGVAILLLALRMIRTTSARVWPAVCLAIAVVVLNVLYLGIGRAGVLPWLAAVESLFYFHAAWRMVAYMLADRRATTDELFAAGAAFTLLVWAFAYAMLLCQALQPTAYAGAGAAGVLRGWNELLFLSFALLSSTGIGDVVPMTGMAKAVADLEMIAGVMYLALVVSRLIGLAVAQERR
ncbi:ion channel [Fulvimonas sp. R45]|uniref:ion channel n=1 Tax=Fulvimonas sp. R45 TaxID=3045937 RepID=UPI00265D984C|nr:ion channel [Fulvimonas sp. R45]MDO1527837.1 ion channel [Fulvimonas sp. R45]